MVLFEICLKQVAKVCLSAAVAQEQDLAGRRQGLGESLQVLICLRLVDIEAAGRVAVMMKDVVVYVAGVGGRDLFRRCIGGRVDSVNPRVVKIGGDDDKRAGEIDGVSDVVGGLVAMGCHDVPWG